VLELVLEDLLAGDEAKHVGGANIKKSVDEYYRRGKGEETKGEERVQQEPVEEKEERRGCRGEEGEIAGRVGKEEEPIR